MTDNHDIFASLKEASLTDAEKARLRNELSFFISEHPATAPLSVRLLDSMASVGNALASRHFMNAQFASAALVLVLFVGVGTSFAAERALPGDPLYAVKIRVNEALRGTLAVSDAAKAQWNVEQVSRRLAEAEKLATQDRLTEVARMQIEISLNESVQRFDENVSKLAKTASGPVAAAAVKSDLEASLLDHEQALTTLAVNMQTGSSTLGPIIETVRARTIALRDRDRDRDGDEDHPQTVAIAMRATKAAPAADEPANSGATMMMTMSAEVEGDAGSGAAASGTNVRAAIDQGEQEYHAGDYTKAFSTFRAAIRALRGEDKEDATTTATTSTTTATTTLEFDKQIKSN